MQRMCNVLVDTNPYESRELKQRLGDCSQPRSPFAPQVMAGAGHIAHSRHCVGTDGYLALAGGVHFPGQDMAGFCLGPGRVPNGG